MKTKVQCFFKRVQAFVALLILGITQTMAQSAAGIEPLRRVAERTAELLKANQQFSAIQQRISAVESTIADRREFYNESVNVYNIAIEQIPAVWVAQQTGYRSRPLLTVAASDRTELPLAFANRTRAAVLHVVVPVGPSSNAVSGFQQR